MSTGRCVALGFEAPLYMPVPEESRALSSGREDEGDRSMFAQAGAYVTTLACHQAAFLLNALKDFQRTYQLTLDHDNWIGARQPTLLLWEAFVSGNAKKTDRCDDVSDHVHDAATAANFFRGNRARLSEFNDVTCDRPLSVIGAVALWSGWRSDISILHERCLVLKPDKDDRYDGRFTLPARVGDVHHGRVFLIDNLAYPAHVTVSKPAGRVFGQLTSAGLFLRARGADTLRYSSETPNSPSIAARQAMTVGSS